MTSPSKKTNVFGFGRRGSEFVPGAWTNGVCGLYDPERHGNEQLKLHNGHGARDVSPTRLQMVRAAAGKSPAEAAIQTIAGMFNRASELVTRQAHGGVTVVAFDGGELLLPVVLGFRQRHRSQCLVGLCDPGEDHPASCPARIAGDRPFTTLFHYREDSPFARTNSPQRQTAFALNLHNGLCLATACSKHNPAPGEVFDDLGAWGPCCQFGFASVPLSTAGSALWTTARRIVGGRYTRASAGLNDLLAQSERATILAHQPESQSTNDGIGLERPRYVAYIAPVETGPTFKEYAERQSVWLKQTFPNASPIYVSGNGVPMLNDRGERFIQVSVLSPTRRSSEGVD